VATVIGQVNLNGCNYQLAYDLLGQSQGDNNSSVRLYGILNVTNNYISWTRGSASVHTSGLQGIGTYYGKGTHILIARDFTFNHDDKGDFSAYIGASLSTTFVSGDCGGVLNLPHINRISTINSFTGGELESDFKVTYTSYGNFTNKLRISIPNVKSLETFNYSSGTSFKLKKETLDYLYNYIGFGDKITLGAVIETYNGSTKLGESSELTRTITIQPRGRIYVGGQWKRATPYLGVKGEWKRILPYVGINGQWKRGN